MQSRRVKEFCVTVLFFGGQQIAWTNRILQENVIRKRTVVRRQQIRISIVGVGKQAMFGKPVCAERDSIDAEASCG